MGFWGIFWESFRVSGKVVGFWKVLGFCLMPLITHGGGFHHHHRLGSGFKVQSFWEFSGKVLGFVGKFSVSGKFWVLGLGVGLGCWSSG